MPARRGSYAKSVGRRKAILDAALDVFGRDGYRGGSLRQIAQRVGITEAAILYHFPSKPELLAAVLEYRDRLAFGVSPLDVEHPVEALAGLLRLMRHNASMPQVIALHTVMSAESLSTEHPAHDYYLERYEFIVARLTEILERGLADGVVRPEVDAARAARAIVALMDGLQVQWLTDPDIIDMAADLGAYIGGLLLPAAGWPPQMSG